MRECAPRQSNNNNSRKDRDIREKTCLPRSLGQNSFPYACSSSRFIFFYQRRTLGHYKIYICAHTNTHTHGVATRSEFAGVSRKVTRCKRIEFFPRAKCFAVRDDTARRTALTKFLPRRNIELSSTANFPKRHEKFRLLHICPSSTLPRPVDHLFEYRSHEQRNVALARLWRILRAIPPWNLRGCKGRVPGRSRKPSRGGLPVYGIF